MDTLLPGITAERMPTSRLTVNVLSVAGRSEAATPVLFVRGNVSSSLFWQPMMLAPRQVLLAHYVKPPHVPEHLDIFVESMLSTKVGEWHYPGDSRRVDAWPGFAAATARRSSKTRPTAPTWTSPSGSWPN